MTPPAGLRPVREIENTWIPMPDGCRLAARIWLPEDAEERPVPAVLEYIPYRKTDDTAVGDSTRHPYVAARGYAGVRVDLRGSGDSDGILLDEYLPQEQDDAEAVIAWLADQSWCTGAVGMIGISWGGFNGLQVAARRPPALKAIVTLCSTDDRYADDVHYMGGCVLASEMIGWASTMLAYNSRAPDPTVVGERWRSMWLDRLERTPPFLHTWLAHQRRDDYWKQGSVCEDYGAIECAVYAVGGWADAYRNAIPRLLEGLPENVPRKALVGPWSHNYPEAGIPGPTIGFLQETVRWWDHWLKGEDTGIMDEPVLRAWMPEPVAPAPFHAERPGRWVAEAAWPSPRVEPQTFALGPGGTLVDGPVEDLRLTFEGAQAAGVDAGTWCPYGRTTDTPPDQRAEDGLALSFTSAPLDEPSELLGFPELVLTVAADRRDAFVAVRLCDVAPDGASLLVCRGVLNLTHRTGHEQPEPLEPGRPVTVRIRLGFIAHAFRPGHRVRVALSPTYWPWIWPSPEPVTLQLSDGTLELPVRPVRPEDDELRPFEDSESAPPLATEMMRAAESGREIHRSVESGRLEQTWIEDSGRERMLRDGLEWETCGRDVYMILDGDPLSASISSAWTVAQGRGPWQIRVETRSTMTADRENFRVTNAVDAYEGATRVFAKVWDTSIPRDHV